MIRGGDTSEDVRRLYQETIIHHARHPRNFGPLGEAQGVTEGRNPLCGDSLSLALKLDGDRVSDVRFHGQGCAISVASASLMTEALKGKTRSEAESLFDVFHRLVTGRPIDDAERARLGKLNAFAHVSQFPVRVKCAILAWHTARAALLGQSHGQSHDVISTE